MEVALLNVKIEFQKNVVVTDDIGNHKNAWTEYYPCHATVSGENGSENAAAGTTVANVDLAFTVRYCRKVDAITADGYRILFGSDFYNIVSIDHMNYKKKTVKFRCAKVRR